MTLGISRFSTAFSLAWYIFKNHFSARSVFKLFWAVIPIRLWNFFLITHENKYQSMTIKGCWSIYCLKYFHLCPMFWEKLSWVMGLEWTSGALHDLLWCVFGKIHPGCWLQNKLADSRLLGTLAGVCLSCDMSLSQAYAAEIGGDRFEGVSRGRIC